MNASDLETTENDDDKIDAMGKLFFIIDNIYSDSEGVPNRATFKKLFSYAY